ncbi:acyl-CoA/acyl-ACP dehydrogenase [Nocardia cyriacigeorgica]|uniref:Acyl-CoA/acyl-ACP dehydrogenase n=1 Tax=Nocardia cyriacigeorgica TaxID=135487 RepID=A0A6P1D7P5_9NOCA|nr:acyl-CoA dehydrogenase family protein [Nocardia cyriacigeorgica]NEW42105.1 acyl-CoA/acyl-ACP dehydrogenase [Nocardia cyriacigeorgica]NEW44853.1 acyl-CoA/acyl-ACP dehydrogenase [Nocardia cyriacigeorgica]NEW53089.1 acyl-CoA/acyl-ACP dehydrogenase [Nocardia cyriacigeorgica]NEW57134.1 acyl-CoA/acyl-ACP dehydrogenase [Nocardia cyriacigeorgica]
MDFTRDEAQDAVAEVVVSLLERESARDVELWQPLVDTGLPAVALPERFGGDEMGVAAVSVLLTELATDAVAVPALPTFGFGVLALLGAPDSVAEAVFPAVAEGAILTAALHEPGAPFTTKPETEAVADGGKVRITGHKVGVPYAEQARWILVPTDAGVAVVDSGADGITRTASPVSGAMPEFTLRFDSVEIPADWLLPEGLADLHRSALASIGAVADGLLDGALKLTAEHVRTRQQFGRPLAEFQAVAQQIADIYVVSRTLHAAAVSANWALAQEEPSPEHESRIDDDLDVLAYTVAAELPRVMQKCHHLHGGIGVDVTHSMHRYYSQAKDIARWLGGESLRLDRLGARCSSI